MNIESIKDLVGFIQQEQQSSDREESLLQKLERQKRLLLKKQELDDWRKIAEATKAYCEQQKLTNRHRLERANATKNLCHKIDQMKIEVQKVIDRSIEQTLNSAQEQSRRFHLKEENREKKRLQIGELKRQLERHEEIAKHIRESKGQAMLRAAKATAEEEGRKLEYAKLERDKLIQVQIEKEAGEWEECKEEFVEIGSLWSQVKMQEQENDAIEANIDSLKAEIVKTTEELEQQRIFEEEEAKRQEEESSQRALTPIKISHPDVGLFKDPNDFPSITTKIEACRRSYENIFKRPEYRELKKMKSEKRVKLRKPSQHMQVLPKSKHEAGKRKLAVVVPKLKIDSTSQPKGVVSAFLSETGTNPTEVVVDQPPRKTISIVPDPEARVPSKVSVTKKPSKPAKQDVTPAVRRLKLKPEKLDFREIPTPPKETKTIENSAPPSKKRAVTMELTQENIDAILSTAKRPKKQHSQKPPEQPKPKTEHPKPKPEQPKPKIEQPNPKTEQPKPKKVTIDPKPVQILIEPEPLSPTSSIPQEEPSASSDPPQSPASVADEPTPEQQSGADGSNSGGSSPSPPRHHPKELDGISLGGSISSLELTDRESVSDLGFDLSPVGSFDESGSGENNKRAGSSSPGMDFDFLDAANSSPPKAPKVASQGSSKRGSQPKKPSKKSDGFDFMEEGGGDDSGAFDFF